MGERGGRLGQLRRNWKALRMTQRSERITSER